MAITKFKEDQKLPEEITCTICGKIVPPNEAVAGLLDADMQQQFACNGHFWSPHQFITGWADFLALERTKRTHNQFTLEYGGAMDVRTVR